MAEKSKVDQPTAPSLMGCWEASLLLLLLLLLLGRLQDIRKGAGDITPA